MRRVLIDEDHPFGTFRHDVEIRHATDHAQSKPVGENRFGLRRGALRKGFFGQRQSGLMLRIFFGDFFGRCR
jgi:hypothetical protein